MGVQLQSRKMALNLVSRGQGQLLRGHGVVATGLKGCQPSCCAMAMKAMSPEDHKISRENFWSKNDRLKRPMSPHLTIYKMQMTSILSITHRFTGLAQSGIMYGYALAAVATTQNHAAILAQVQGLGLGAAPIVAAKFAIAWPVMFHLFNGCRHLSWDMGYGFHARFVQDRLDCGRFVSHHGSRLSSTVKNGKTTVFD